VLPAVDICDACFEAAYASSPCFQDHRLRYDRLHVAVSDGSDYFPTILTISCLTQTSSILCTAAVQA